MTWAGGLVVGGLVLIACEDAADSLGLARWIRETLFWLGLLATAIPIGRRTWEGLQGNREQ
jgi:hypothetical protein